MITLVPSARVTLAEKVPDDTTTDCETPLRIRFAEETFPVTVPETSCVTLSVTRPSSGMLIITPGLLWLTETVIVVDVPVLPAASVAITRILLLPVFRLILWLKFPLATIVKVVLLEPDPVTTVTLAVAEASSIVPVTTVVLELNTCPSAGPVKVTTGAKVSGITVSVVFQKASL